MTAQRRAVPMGPMVAAMVGGAAVAGGIFWRLNLTAIDSQITAKTGALKKLVLSGKIPPNDEVMAYLTARQASLDRRYQEWLQRVASAPVAEAASADPQLYFQEQVHEVQRTLERLATARAMAVPEQLGFPKELPPSDTVPRLLIQLSLIKEAAALIFEQGVSALTSFKIDDPQPVPQPEGEEPFLTRLPVRVRFNASLPQLLKVLGAIQRVTPLIDILAIRASPAATAVPAGTATEDLEMELLLSRYLVSAETPGPAGDDEQAAEAPRAKPAASKRPAKSAKPAKPTSGDE
jgi:hypothetical protein